MMQNRTSAKAEENLSHVIERYKRRESSVEETLTINRLGLPPQLRRIFSSTNLIESCFSRAGDLCRGVNHWRDGNMACRWAASVLLDAQSRFRRIQAYCQLPLLINAMATFRDRQEAAT